MAYSTVTLVRKSLGDITEAELATSDIEEAIEEADSLIDSYISVKYALPLPVPAPKMIRRISRNLSACHCYNDVIASGISLDDDPKIKNRCERSMETLENLRDGKQHLIDDNGDLLPANDTSASIPWSSTNTYEHPQFFDVDDDTNWKFPPTMIDDIEDSRDD